MNIKSVRVNGLFDDFDHELEFGRHERIMLVIGPNGFGKTTTLKLIDMLFNQAIGRLAKMPFREVDVLFDDETRLTARRHESSRVYNEDQIPLTLEYHRGNETVEYTPTRVSISQKDLGIPLAAIEEFVPVLDRIDARRWLNIETGVVLDLSEVITDFWEEFPPDRMPDDFQSPDWLQEIRRSVTVRLVNTERLTHLSRRWRHRRAVNPRRTVTRYSQQLASHIKESIAKYGALSQSLDRTFPARLVNNRQHSSVSIETLRTDLNAIDKKRSQLEKVGLLEVEQTVNPIRDLDSVDESQRGVLAVYAQDAQEKLAVFDDLYEKISAYTSIANSRFSLKQVTVSADGLTVTRDDDTTLHLEKLSSGEQHELVMLYELLFRASSNSLFLIDEPELSLHVAWQEKWVDDLEKTAKLSGFRAIVATHSPEIIGDRWHLTVELRGREKV